MTIGVRGIGWLTNAEYGCVRNDLRRAWDRDEGHPLLPKRDIFSYPFKNFGRLDPVSRMTAYAVSLALEDAGVEYSPMKKQDIGIVGTNCNGSLRSDIEYFRDYLECGRTLSRANLFIYTLPSSPLGEAAIHFGFLGPMLYAARERGALSAVLDLATEMVLDEEAPVTLAGMAEEHEALYFVLSKDDGGPSAALVDVAEARLIVETTPDVMGMVRKFTDLKSKRGPCEN
jgi:3-oxoacyl-[acyl-carrier-protein] synthase II